MERIAVVTPRPAEAMLAAAAALGIDEVYAVGGAHAVGALAYGTKTIRSVDKIVGPGGPWVTAAKLLVSARVAIDLPAGPSEVLVIADGTASPAAVAASLLAQAEHGPDSDAGLLALDADLARRVRERLDGAANVRIEAVDSLDAALRRAEAYAPEHLELHVAGAEEVAPLVRNAGSVFVGTSSVVGDYAAGATHVLPTGGLARGAGGLGLEAFLSRCRPCARPTSPPPGRSVSRSPGRRAAAPRGGARVKTRPLDERYSPYRWSPPTAEIAARHGCGRSRCCASTRTRRTCPVSRPCRSASRSRGSTSTRTAPTASSGRPRPRTSASSRSRSWSAQGPTT